MKPSLASFEHSTELRVVRQGHEAVEVGAYAMTGKLKHFFELRTIGSDAEDYAVGLANRP